MPKHRRILLCMLVAVAVYRADPTSAVTIHIDYSLDTASSNFFGSGNPQGATGGAQAKDALNAAAAFYSGILADTFTAIQTPPKFFGSQGGSNTWSWQRTYSNPVNGLQNAELNVPIAANEFVVMVGARDLPSGVLGIGGPGGYSWQSNPSGVFTSQEITTINQTTAQFKSAVETRGEMTGFARWGGSIAVDSNTKWHFNHTTAPAVGESDFYTVALHELAHTLGFGASQEWQDLVSGATFIGTHAMAQYISGGPVPLAGVENTDSGGHWNSAIMSTVYGGSASQTPVMVPMLPAKTRRQLTNLDAAALVDLGWEITLPQPVPGDYNRNGIVDAADYTVWRNTLGSTTDLRANGNNTGASANKIDQADYTFWKSHFGQHAGSGAGAISVPEPAGAVLVIVVGITLVSSRRRSHPW